MTKRQKTLLAIENVAPEKVNVSKPLFSFKIETKTINNQSILLINARDLHTQLQVGRDFSNWIKNRIETCNFIENQDFIIDSPNLANQKIGRGGDRRTIEYFITIDMAKHLAMLEKNDIGHQARLYFIDIERKYFENSKSQSFEMPVDRLSELQMIQSENRHKYDLSLMTIESINRVLNLSDTSKVVMYHKVCDRYAVDSNFLPEYVEQNGVLSISALISKFNIKISAMKLNKVLEEHGIIEKIERVSKSSPTGKKSFWHLTEKGLAFGKNEAHHTNPREVQPLYFIEKFINLAKLVKVI